RASATRANPECKKCQRLTSDVGRRQSKPRGCGAIQISALRPFSPAIFNAKCRKSGSCPQAALLGADAAGSAEKAAFLIIRIRMAPATPGPSSRAWHQHVRVEPVIKAAAAQSAKFSGTSTLSHHVVERRPPALRRCWLFLPGADRG